MNKAVVVDAHVTPENSLNILSQMEVSRLKESHESGLYDLFRRCALAVLNSGNSIDNAKVVMEQYQDFSIQIVQQERGLKLELKNAPAAAFVDGEMIQGIKEHLFAVLRDTVYVNNEIDSNPKFDLDSSSGITNAVFHILRNAGILNAQVEPNLVVCWGGHSISREEYDYTKEVGYALGLRDLNVCTGCGHGAMKGPMKGAAVGHAKQRITGGRYVGITEPGIIAAESPNPIVNALVIMPDIESRLEAFARVAHAIVVFPGGVGTAEEILYLLGILLHSENAEMPLPLIFTGPASAEHYFSQINNFIGQTLGIEAQQRYKIMINDPDLVAREVKRGMHAVREFRRAHSDAYYYNWLLRIERAFQSHFHPTHENMNKLDLRQGQDLFDLAANLRRAFSGIVAGNVKLEGIRAIEQHGPFEIHGDKQIMGPMDELLHSFVAHQRMKLAGDGYVPCYRLVS